MKKLISIVIISKTLSLRIKCIPEKIGALGLDAIALLTTFTPLANVVLSQEISFFLLVFSISLIFIKI